LASQTKTGFFPIASATAAATRFSSPDPSRMESGGCFSEAQIRKVDGSALGAAAALPGSDWMACASDSWAQALWTGIARASRAAAQVAARRSPPRSGMVSFPQ